VPDEPHSGWGGRVAVAIVHSDPPVVYLAEDHEVLSRLVALRVVARSRPEEVGGAVDDIREALLDERWADAVAIWIEATGDALDAYPDEDVWTNERLDSERAALEIRVAPIFEEAGNPE
jgi:hypothetical protein